MKKPDDILKELRQRVDAIADKSKKVDEILDFVLIYGDSYGSKIVPYIDEAITICKENGFEIHAIICYLNLLFFKGMTQGSMTSIYNSSIPEMNEMVEKLKSNEEFYPMGLNLLAFYHWFRGEYEKGFDAIFEAIKISEAQNNVGTYWNYFALAVFYFDTKDLENSTIYYQKSFDYFKAKDHAYGAARSMNGLGTIAIVQNRTKDALPMLEYSANVYREFVHYSGLSRALNDMGMLHKKEENYDTAIGFLNESIELRKEIDHFQGLITTYTELGETYLFKKEYALALEQFEKGLDLALQTKTYQKQIRLYKLFYDTYKELGDTELALKNFESFFEIKSQLLSDDAANNIKRIQTKYEKEKSEKEAEIERLKNIELAKANAIIEQKNKDITDSINYAKRIQFSLLPTDKYIDRTLERLKKK